jgi:hypothetical protein
MDMPLWFGPYGSGVLPDNARDYGVNAAWFHGFNEERFEACAKLGITACVEFKTFRADFAKHPELVPIGMDGKPIRYGKPVQGICLSQSDYLAEIDRELRGGLDAYQPAGIWLDYLTYAGWFETPVPDLQESCFCRDCIADFCEATGIDADTPAELLARHQAAWTEHKCRRIAANGRRFAAMIKERHPSCVVGAYMCPWAPDEYDGALRRIFAQDYTLLEPAIDVFTPLIYCSKSGRGTEWSRQWLEQSPSFVPGSRRVQLILDALDYPGSLEDAARSSVPSWGIQLFRGAEVFDDRDKANAFREAVEAIRLRAEQQR